ncbi:MAG: DNA-3-methyladenine glycosylase 2 family protein [Dehalococcoidia bacterium]|nr:DNA-3-methyladenine glycosylase 2 family protein [Dehalococcoidia bacterium]
MAGRRLPFSLARAEAHLRAADRVLARLIDAHGRFTPRPGDDPYNSLVRTILHQQLAGPAARTIERRWRALYGGEQAVPAPAAVLATSDEAFRSAGVSRQKAAYLRDLAAHVADGRLDFAAFARSSDDEVLRALTAVHGLGTWSAQMFLMFELGRPDVLPVGDLGVRRGMELAYGLAEEPSLDRMREIGAAWAPYRSVGSWYMWRAVEG